MISKQTDSKGQTHPGNVNNLERTRRDETEEHEHHTWYQETKARLPYAGRETIRLTARTRHRQQAGISANRRSWLRAAGDTES
jgi:hypothetical protein